MTRQPEPHLGSREAWSIRKLKQDEKGAKRLLGRKTYEIFAAYWPHHTNEGSGINKATKYVASHAPMEFTWEHSVLLKGDVVDEVKKAESAGWT